MVECNRGREEIGSSNKFKSIEEINEKNLTRLIVLGIIYGELPIPCFLILWKKKKKK